MTALSAATAGVFVGRIALDTWAIREVEARRAAIGARGTTVGSFQEFVHHMELTHRAGLVLLAACCLGFVIATGMWLRTMKRRIHGGRTT